MDGIAGVGATVRLSVRPSKSTVYNDTCPAASVILIRSPKALNSYLKQGGLPLPHVLPRPLKFASNNCVIRPARSYTIVATARPLPTTTEVRLPWASYPYVH